ncbi:MAG TPA: hypothetical protein VJ896_01810 [Bacteroidales bacterium]|nr:hypothetical protein [Bacteroidales bacterium]
MKRIIHIILFSLSLLFLTSSSFAQKEIFIKEFQFELKKISSNQYENEYFLTITLNKNSLYKFTVLNHIGDFPGIAVVQILENEKVVATNKVGDKYYEKFMFKCTKTGFYDILIHFEDNEKGSSLIKLFLVQ